MAAEDPSELVAHPSTGSPNAPLLAPRSLFSFRPSEPLAATRGHSGEIPDSDDLKLFRARYRKQQPILHDRLSKLTPARRSAALTISTTAATLPASVGLQSMSGSSMSEGSPNDSQVSICTTVSTASPSSDSSSSGVDVRPAFDFRAGLSLKEEKGKKSSESEHKREHHQSNKNGCYEEADRNGRFAASEDSFSEISLPCSESTREFQDGRPRGVRQALSKVSASFKKKLHKLWPEDGQEHAQLRWIHLPTDGHDNNNPFYQVRYGVQFQNLVPQPPARFPYASQIAYASRYGSAVTIDPSDRADLREEERLRERQNRRALLRRRSTAGRFRRRPNITLPPTEGRITEPVEVARIRRAYGGTLASNTHPRSENRDSKSLLERMNRQVRTGTQEWTLTGVEQQQQQPPVPTTASILPGDITRIAVSDANQKIASRRSVNRAVSTRAPGRPVRREDLHRSQSLFSTQWEAYQRKKLSSRRDSNALGLGSRDPVSQDDPSFAQDLTARLKQVVAADQRAESSTGVSMPALVVTPCAAPDPAATLCGNSSSLVPEITEPVTSFLMAPRTASRGQGEERRRRRGSPSPYASDHEVESDNISVRLRSSRSSVHSVSSHVSAASSIANSIYSTLSEDWIRPPYYALPRSARYPLSLQRSIRTLPPHIMIGVRRRSELSSDVKTLAEATRLARQMRTRGLRDYDGSTIRPDVGDQLHTVEFSVVYKPIERVGVAKEEQEEQNCKESRDPAPLFMNPCKSALPLTADSMGFVEYGSDDEDADLTGDGSERVDAVDIGEAEKRVVLDVNDTSAMVAKGINPLDPHPDPLAFYNTHFAYFQKHGCFVGDDDRSDPSFPDVKIKDPWNARELYGGEQSLQDGEDEEEKDGMRPAYAQLLKGDASIPPSSPPALLREPLSRRKTVLKKAYARVRSFLSSNDPPPAATMIATTLTLPMNRFQVCSRAKIAPEAGSTVAAMDGRGCGVEGDQDWIARLPCGARTLGQFDRDWLDAMPPLSRTE